MHTLKVTLKQHTPLIHFQHDQDGATLRASEVKPKLDRYILTQLGNGKYQDGVKQAKANDWLVGKGEHPALDYKMRIEAEGRKEYMIGSLIGSNTPNNKPRTLVILKSTPYFAQEQENRDIVKTYKVGEEKKSDFHEDKWRIVPKKGLMWQNIRITILSVDTLNEVIKSHISDFFLCTNFGTRSNKGFGSFTVDLIDGCAPICYDENRIMAGFKTHFEFCYKKNKSVHDLPSVFDSIKSDYQRLKSGVNFNYYKKSLLFCYAVNKMEGAPRWEKRHFKQEMKSKLKDEGCFLKAKKNREGYFNAPIMNCKGDQNWKDIPNKYRYNYIRALLGLAEQFEFQLDGKYEKAVVKIGSEEIERFASPLFFKVIDNAIYMLGNNSPVILGKKFNFNYKIVKKDKESKETIEKKLPIEDDTLKTPDDFSVVDFIRYAVNEADTDIRLDYKKIF